MIVAALAGVSVAIMLHVVARLACVIAWRPSLDPRRLA